MRKKEDKRGSDLWRYAGMGAEFAGMTALGVFLGLKIDGWIRISFPLFVWFLPLMLIIGMLIKIVIDTKEKP